MISTTLEILVSLGFWVAVFRVATPLIFGVVGEMLCQRSGVVNLGIEGIMTMGAMTAWLMVHTGAPLPAGVLTAALAGALLGLIHALWTVRWGLPQPVVGIAMTLLAMNLSYFIVRAVLPDVTSPPTIDTFRPVMPALTGQVPLVGPVLATFTWYTYAALLLALVFAFVMQRTPLGLAVRLVGENPLAAESQGINVHVVRFAAVATGSALMAIGGAFLTTAATDAFYFGMVNGRGWVCVALVVLAGWRAPRALGVALLFGAFEALQLRLQLRYDQDIAYQFFLIAPYALCILALVLLSRRGAQPAALMKPYTRA